MTKLDSAFQLKKRADAKIETKGLVLSTPSRSPQPSSGTESQTPPHASDFEGGDQGEAAVIRRAVEVIGDRSNAMRWLGTPVRALNYATPISLVHDSEGRDAVFTVLGRLEQGVL
jgi:hypothetical protein